MRKGAIEASDNSDASERIIKQNSISFEQRWIRGKEMSQSLIKVTSEQCKVKATKWTTKCNEKFKYKRNNKVAPVFHL